MREYIEEIISHKYAQAVFIIAAAFIMAKLVGIISKAVSRKKSRSVMRSFISGMIQALIFLAAFMKIASMSNVLSSFANTILMSSSLLVVVLGFVFQEGLSNIVHGYIIAMSKSFEIGDRVEIDSGGESIKGYIKTLNLRHTVVANIMDNSDVIIPNSVLDKAIIRNLTQNNSFNRYPLTIAITYKDAQDPKKLKLAKEILSEEILGHAKSEDVRTDKTKPLFVKVDLADSAVTLTAFVSTKTAEDNYEVCSEIREKLLERFGENDISFAFSHLEISGELSTRDLQKGDR